MCTSVCLSRLAEKERSRRAGHPPFNDTVYYNRYTIIIIHWNRYTILYNRYIIIIGTLFFDIVLMCYLRGSRIQQRGRAREEASNHTKDRRRTSSGNRAHSLRPASAASTTSSTSGSSKRSASGNARWGAWMPERWPSRIAASRLSPAASNSGVGDSILFHYDR